MTIKYLFVVDDEGARRETYNSIAKSSDGRLEIELHWTPKEAAEGFSLADREYVGAILDFHLQAQAGQDSAALNDGTPVTTGLGMMAWLRERAPELPLYAITDLGRDHAPLFYTAASDWFNATPLFHVDLSNPTLTRPEREVIATEFVSPATRQLSHKVDMVLDARVHFEGLFACQNSSKTDAKLTYDWLCAFARAGKNPDRLRRELNAMPYGYRIGKI
ncbi:MAG: hypothetical protein HOV67_04050, partial [Kribbellaceae bacterium]|nr:hypothetical protein [Kribbellaceae bacterium]